MKVKYSNFRTKFLTLFVCFIFKFIDLPLIKIIRACLTCGARGHVRRFRGDTASECARPRRMENMLNFMALRQCIYFDDEVNWWLG